MSTSSGLAAESVAAQWLEAQGYHVIDRNWRTKWCEIDIVAKKDGRLHFIEVKYRRSDSAGSGLSYITEKKLQQMSRAATIWVNQYDYDGGYELSAIELSGQPPKIDNFIPELT